MGGWSVNSDNVAVWVEDDAPEFVPEKVNIATLRASASIPHGDFCANLMTMGIIPPVEAIAAAQGTWPASMNGFLDWLDVRNAAEMPPAQVVMARAAVQITFAGARNIRYDNEFVALLAYWLHLPEATVDALFGIVPPTPII